MLEIKNIKKTYHMSNHDVVALDGISLDIKPGNLVAIVGPSGCGKTSLMNIIGALDSDYEGEIIINGKSLNEAHGKDVDTYRKNTIGFIFQHFTLINSLNTFENIALAYDVSNVKKDEKKKRTDELLASVGLSEHAKKKVNVLSGGQKQRVAIARALANNPDIIIADEPTGALDHRTGIQVMELLKDIAKDRIVVMVTHSPELAEEYANVIVSMEDGKIIDVKDNIEPEKTDVVLSGNNVSKSNMSLFTALKLAYRNLKLKKGRTIFTSIGMSIGIIGIALALALTNGTKQAVEDQVMSIFPANSVMVTNNNKDKNKHKRPKALTYNDYEKIKDIAKDADSIFFIKDTIMTTIASLDKDTADMEKFQEAMAKGEELKPFTFLAASMPSNSYGGKIGFGRMPAKGKSYETMLSLSTAEDLVGKDGKVEDILNKDMHVSVMDMETEKSKVMDLKIVGVTSENTLLSTMYFEPTFADAMMKDYFNINKKDVKSSSVSMFVNDTKNVEKYVDGLNDKQDKYKFETIAKSILGTVNIILDAVRNGLIAFSSVSVFVAILMIAIVVYISVLERKQEIGIIRAIGGKTKDIRNMFLGESLAIGLLAGIIGTGVSYGICALINKVVYSILSATTPNLPPINVANLDIQTAVMLVVVCGILSVISGLIPSLNAAKLDPIDAIRKK